jgi:LysM repeat protein
MVPIAIGLVGVAFGAIALFMSISNGSDATKKINDLAARVDDVSTKVQGVSDLEGKVKLNTDTITGLRSSVQDFINQASGVIQKQGQEIADLTAKSSTKTASSGTKGAKTDSGNSGPGGTHTVAAGEYFSSIAKKYGVSLAALEAANPGVDSSKLKVGQKINLPGAKTSSAASSAPAPTAPAAAAPAASTP